MIFVVVSQKGNYGCGQLVSIFAFNKTPDWINFMNYGMNQFILNWNKFTVFANTDFMEIDVCLSSMLKFDCFVFFFFLSVDYLD